MLAEKKKKLLGTKLCGLALLKLLKRGNAHIQKPSKDKNDGGCTTYAC